MKRGYYSFLILVTLYAISFFLPFLMSNRAIVLKYDNNYYFPSLKTYFYETFGTQKKSIYFASDFQQELNEAGEPALGEVDYRALKKQFAQQNEGNWVILPPIPYSPTEEFLTRVTAETEDPTKDSPPLPPSSGHWLGTDSSNRDVLVRLAYGFRISISFALIVVFISYSIGITVGALLGFFGRWVDIIGQRFVEIWGAIPFLYTIMIINSIFGSSFLGLVGILAAFSWLTISYYIRGEFYREKAKDYVAAAVATGESNFVIMMKHILPNALTPVITFAPFAIVASITALVSLDFLGFGLRPPTPSWGDLIKQAHANLQEWHLVVFPLLAIFFTLQMIVFIGEAVREAFDPKVYSRLR